MSEARDFDLIVIGGGSGGLAGAFRAAEHGARVALMEPAALGGTCVNVGCVPKKAMWFAADLAARIDQARRIGFDLPDAAPLDWQEMLLRRSRYIDNIHRGYRQRLQDAGIVLLPHRGSLTGMPGEVRCGDLRWRAGHLLLATGARPLRPAIPGIELGAVSDDFFALSEAPKRVAVVGGGYVAVELAGVLQALGSEVELFVRNARLLQSFDEELAQRLAEHMRATGMRLHMATDVKALARDDDGRIQVRGNLDADAEQGFDFVLLATGRSPHTEGLGLAAAGVRTDDHGHVLVDEWQNTTRPNTYAVGDVTAQPALTPYAIAAARRLMDRLFGGQPEARLRVEQVPTVLFSHPPIAQLGLSEEQARERHGSDVHVYRADFRPMLNALSDCNGRSLFKLVCVGAERRVVGLHLLGEAVDEILQGFAVAVQMGATLADFQDTLAIHPTSAEELVLIRP